MSRKFVIALCIGICLVMAILLVPRGLLPTNRRDDLEKRFVSKPAAAMLDYFGVGYDELDMIDEPPGKLRENQGRFSQIHTNKCVMSV
jgi:hypothetical protein